MSSPTTGVTDFQVTAKDDTPPVAPGANLENGDGADPDQNLRNRVFPLALAALGVVFGDIGTSPIYALRQCFYGLERVSPTPPNVFGILSLIIWALVLVVSVKYLLFVMRANNKGEGGIAALVALLNPWRSKRGSQRYVLMLLGLFGAALLYGDGSITPAISVLSAVEGLKVAAPGIEPYVIPVTVTILISLFLIQKKGTGGIGLFFGPLIGLWLLVLAALGIRGILLNPQILTAFDPIYAFRFFLDNRSSAFLVLGAVFLVVTGGEALYADMGHFGVKPIRLAWFGLVLPALLLNYLGQGALILGSRGDATQPFYDLAPSWAIYPLVALATMATVIASQAIISGAFSLTRQLVYLNQLPRVNITQTSSARQGQIYIGSVNWILMFATIGLVFGFKSSSALGSAYGVAVSGTMVITTVLAYFVARRFKWNKWLVLFLCTFFLIIDTSFFSANLFKVADGGWYPILAAILVFTVMTCWSRGRILLRQQLAEESESLDMLVKRIAQDQPYRIPGTAVFLTGDDMVPPRLLHHLDRHHVLQNCVLLVTVQTMGVPRVPATERLELYAVSPDIMRVIVKYGFMQGVNVPLALRLCHKLGLQFDIDNVTYYLGRETLIPSPDVVGMMQWRERLFAFLSRNALRATAYYQLPPEDVVELGFQVRI